MSSRQVGPTVSRNSGRGLAPAGVSKKRRNKGPQPPLSGAAKGPDRKGKYTLTIPETEKRLGFYGGIEGESALVRRGRRGRRGETGDLLSILEPSPFRREARCRHFGACGGCTMQHVSEEVALKHKTATYYEALASLCPDAEMLPPVASPISFAYRTKVELTFMKTREGETHLGFHRRGRFDRLVDVGRCWLTGLPAKLLDGLREWFRKYGFQGWDPRENVGDLRYLLYRRASWGDQDLAAIVLSADLELTKAAHSDLTSTFQEAGVDSALILRQSSVAGAVVPDSEEPLYGTQVLIEKLGDLEFELSWKSFYQVNPRAYLRLLDTIDEWRVTPTGQRILDLFCGVGSIGLYLHRSGDQLLGVELVEEAVADARKNAARNGIDAKFEAKPAEALEELETDLLILDPPRSGCHPKLIKSIVSRPPADELFYISCGPHRLLEELPELGKVYRLIRAQAFDFFPQTHHCEFLLQFKRVRRL